jgi:menaquinol-cytochrome c reductase iron-sulfur subunit
MTATENLSRRGMLMKLGILFNGVIAAGLAIPVLGYLLAPLARMRKGGDASWLSLGALDQYPIGQTRLAAFRNPDVKPWDGKTAESVCWVRRIDQASFQVFAINCAHLGCPVRWFQQSRLFMCPCHGGVYYENGARASGPPERGLFEYAYKLDEGKLFVKAGELPTLGSPGPSPGSNALVNIGGKQSCA